jgi:hypothetical protein
MNAQAFVGQGLAAVFATGLLSSKLVNKMKTRGMCLEKRPFPLCSSHHTDEMMAPL